MTLPAGPESSTGRHRHAGLAEQVEVLGLGPADGDVAALTVRDYGSGLEPGDEVRVFRRFWRADPSRVRSTGGTGLGLAIAQEDAKLHGGELDAWGAPGGGAQFRLVLPVRPGGPLHDAPLRLRPADATAGAEALR